MSAPLIGITGRRVSMGRLADIPASMTTARAELHLVDYARCVAGAGGIPVQLSHESDPDVVARLDGLVLSGGGDIDPCCYGAAPTPRLVEVDPRRDEHELAVYAAALDARLPVLGICRGLQLVNVAHGGTLIDRLPDGQGELHADFGRPRDRRAVTVQLLSRGRPTTWYGDRVGANCIHHQAVAELGRDVEVVGRAADGVVEAVEVAGAPVVGLQWHPEMFDGVDPCFWWLVRAARGEDRGPGTGRCMPATDQGRTA